MDPVPDSVHELYVAYKHSTKYVLDWLWTTSGFRASRPAKTRLSSTQDIIDSARLVQQNRVTVPGSVITSLSNAIKQRQRAAEFYRKTEITTPSKNHDSDNTGHCAFIDRLQCALSILSPLERPAATAKLRGVAAPVEGGSTKAQNQFSLLETYEDRKESDDPSVGATDTQAHADTPESAEELLAAGDDIALEDDDFAKRMEVQRFITDMNTLLDRLDALCSRVAMEEFPLALAAWLSSCATQDVCEQAFRLKSIIPDASVLFGKWLCRDPATIGSSEPSTLSDGGRTNDGTCDYRALHQAYLVLKRMCPRRGLSNAFSLDIEWQKPSDFVKKLDITAAGSDTGSDTDRLQGDADVLALEALLRNIRRVISVASEKSEAVAPGLGFDMIEYMDQHVETFLAEGNAGIPIHVVFSLQLLLSTYKSFLWCANDRNCRNEYLHIMLQIGKEMSATAEALETYVPAYPKLFSHRSLLADQMKDSHREIRFHLYAQAPWTAGEHMMRNLHFCLEDGLQLCSRYHFVSAILHLYNALRSLCPLFRRITMFDQLCDLFKDTMFRGSFPTENFSSHYRVCRGQKLSRDKLGKYVLKTVPGVESPSCAISASRMSTLCQLASDSYQLTASSCRMVNKAVALDQSLRHKRSKRATEAANNNCQWWASRSDRVAKGEFSGSSPILIINFFAVFRLCLELCQDVIPDFADITDILKEGRSAEGGIKWIDILLEDIADHAKDNSAESTDIYDIGVERAKEVFTSFENRLPSSFPLWTL